jgi:predicted transcriptional regulator
MANRLTDLDKTLQEMAAANWPQFVAMVGPEAIIAAKVCLLRQAGKSYGEIAVRLGVTERQAGYACTKCEVKD